MLKVYSAQYPTEAHLLKGLLESYNIKCEVRGESIFNIRGEVPLTAETAPSLWIFNDSQFDEARSVISAYEKSTIQDGAETEMWLCSSCGESLESQFTNCWNCGTSREEDLLLQTDHVREKMRRSERQTTEAEALSILETGEYGIMSTVDPSGNEPYGIPLNYCFTNNCIYFHSARKGRKNDILKANPTISFCVVGKTEIEQEEFSTKFESCVIKGTVSQVFEEEKNVALQELIKKYSPDFISEGEIYIKKSAAVTNVYKIRIDSISGKAKK